MKILEHPERIGILVKKVDPWYIDRFVEVIATCGVIATIVLAFVQG